jgi:hypothetical protein
MASEEPPRASAISCVKVESPGLGLLGMKVRPMARRLDLLLPALASGGCGRVQRSSKARLWKKVKQMRSVFDPLDAYIDGWELARDASCAQPATTRHGRALCAAACRLGGAFQSHFA